jgi:hypothetical protein
VVSFDPLPELVNHINVGDKVEFADKNDLLVWHTGFVVFAKKVPIWGLLQDDIDRSLLNLFVGVRTPEDVAIKLKEIYDEEFYLNTVISVIGFIVDTVNPPNYYVEL